MDRRLTRLAERQHGVVGRRQLFALGMGEHHVDVLLRRGHVDAVSRGVYRVAGAPMTPLAEAVAAALRCGPDAVVVGPRMLAVLRIRGCAVDGPLVVLTRPGRRVRGVPWRTRPNPLPVDRDAVRISGVPSLHPARLLLEAAVDAPDASALVDLVDGHRWVGALPALEVLRGRWPDHPGTTTLARSGLLADGAGESRPERRLAEALSGLGGRPQVEVVPGCRVDLWFEAGRLAIEYDGRAFHDGPRARDRDARRDARLRAAGIGVLRLRAADLADPVALRARVVQLLADRTGMIGAVRSS